ncbi:unnamed protein product [Notodromas monacha]|uniref:Protein kinase domain-containing protein n=1 Tax=Notodromas monacha TaxID=399045 RepID=A0A7R9G911_9CRUS|nr:unnamed protein product [Notodromas monacha]CAG0913835.1 unnamed protein product [Notodromas monacha]
MTLACAVRSDSSSSASNPFLPELSSKISDYVMQNPISPCFNSRGVVSHVLIDDRDFAVRRYGLDGMSSVEFRRIREEVRRVKGELRHPNILPYLHVFAVNDYNGEKGFLDPGPQIWIVTPMCDQGSALDLLSFYPEGLPEKAISYIGQNVLRALAYIHEKGYVHRAEEVRRVKGELRHPNILPYLHVFAVNDYNGEKGFLDPGPQIWIVTPMCDQGSALDLLSFYPEGLPEKAISYIGQNVLRALAYIHEKGYVHRAVKASHVLLCSDGRVLLTGLRCCVSYKDPRLGEYGEFARSVSQDPEFSGFCIDTGSTKIWRSAGLVHHYPCDDATSLLPWMAPEILEQSMEGYGTSSDIYSFGILCCELGNGEAPYVGLGLTMLLLEKLRGSPPYLLDASTFAPGNQAGNKDSGVGDSVACSETAGASSNMVSVLAQEAVYRQRGLSASFHDVTDRCLFRNPGDRPTAVELLDNYPFLHPGFLSSSQRAGSSTSLLNKCRAVSSVSVSSRVDVKFGMPEDLVKVFKSAAGLSERVRRRNHSGASKDQEPTMSVKLTAGNVPGSEDFTWDFS